MKRINSKSARIVAFVAALGASAALVGTAASATGAYFTDSQSGNLTAGSGHLNVGKTSDYALNFDNLVPGQSKDRVVSYHTDSSTPEDIWLEFPAGTAYGQFTGAKGTSTNNNVDGYSDGGLGRFGFFQVKNNAGDVLFRSYNLQNSPDGTSGCADTNGHGYNQPPTSRDDTPAYCGVPHYMLIESNVASGTDAGMTLTFGLSGRATGQNTPAANVPFQVVATQHGVRPDAQNF